MKSQHRILDGHFCCKSCIVCLKKRKNERGPLENKCGNFRPFPETNLKKYFVPTKLSID